MTEELATALRELSLYCAELEQELARAKKVNWVVSDKLCETMAINGKWMAVGKKLWENDKLILKLVYDRYGGNAKKELEK